MSQLGALLLGLGTLLVLLLLIVLVPYLRGSLYRQVKYRIKEVPDLDDPDFAIAVMGVSGSLLSSGQATGYWFDVSEIYAVRQDAICTAKRSIHFETFYMTPGRRADEFAEAVIERARAGVEVRLIVDSFGVITMSQKYWHRLKRNGVEVRFYHPFSWRTPLTYNIRDHRKLLVIDGKVAFVGGTGVSDHWDGMPGIDEAPWLDFEMRFEGAIATTLEGIFTRQWLYVGGAASLDGDLFHPPVDDELPMLITVRSAPSASSSVCALLCASILAAKERIWIASPYFLLDGNSCSALLKAKRQGVDVRVLTVGPHNDKQFVYQAVREQYQRLLDVGIQVYEYAHSMMHAKVLLIDDRWVSTGSTNLDPRSLFHNDELNVSLSEPKLAEFVEQFFLWSFSQSCLIDRAKWEKRPFWHRVMGRIALLLRWQL